MIMHFDRGWHQRGAPRHPEGLSLGVHLVCMRACFQLSFLFLAAPGHFLSSTTSLRAKMAQHDSSDLAQDFGRASPESTMLSGKRMLPDADKCIGCSTVNLVAWTGSFDWPRLNFLIYSIGNAHPIQKCALQQPG